MEYSTDDLMWKTLGHLFRDFRSVQGTHAFNAPYNRYKEGLTSYRRGPQHSVVGLSPYFAKQVLQLNNFLKRYTFENDAHSDAARECMTWEKFQEVQTTVQTALPTTATTREVLRVARTIISKILGEYDECEHVVKCYFGKRASKGVPRAESYLHTKLRKLTGSAEQSEWFVKTYLSGDCLLPDVMRDCNTSLITTADLDYTTVPKSWKILRGILPHTVIGGLFTSGLGEMISERLKDRAGLDITKLQERHRNLVKYYSVNRRCVTADLSSASDSFGIALLCALLPRKWFRCVMLGVNRHVTYKKKTYMVNSIMLMGIGFTFPLQTLLFYALLKAVQQLTGVGSPEEISVYGDDLIYPRGMHKYVSKLFNSLSFKLNQDKTFVWSNYRESCGEDYLHGVAVRPFSPEGCAAQLGKNAYEAEVYKLINGLLRRWHASELPQTLRFLTLEILRVRDCVLQVPPSFPDYSGVKVDRVQTYSSCLPWSPVTLSAVKADVDKVPVWRAQYRMFSFLSLRIKKDYIVCENEIPYYWDVLRTGYSHDNTIRDDHEIRGQSHIGAGRVPQRLKVVEGKDKKTKEKVFIAILNKVGNLSVKYTCSAEKVHSWVYTVGKTSFNVDKKLDAIIIPKVVYTCEKFRCNRDPKYKGLEA